MQQTEGAERKLVTVLFADIVGSTDALAARDPEVIRAGLDTAFREIERILTQHGATVEKFIGDAVMAVFGIPRAHDDDADRAVRAAFGCREAVATLSLPVPVQLRIGVNTGEAVAGGPSARRVLVTGEPVNAAARLQQAAVPGEILVGELTRSLTRSAVRYGAARTIEAKGLGAREAWPAMSLATALPEQARGVEGLRAPLIGRDVELRLLRDTFERVRADGRAHLVTVFGPPGAGKSRLVETFLSELDGPVRRGRCLPYGEAITYYPVLLILRADAGIEPSDTREAAVSKLEAAVREAFGASDDHAAVRQRVLVLAGLADAKEALPEVPTESVAEELRWGLRRYLERRSDSGPLTIVFDDIHWAEPALLDVIEDLAEWARAPLLVLCLARPDLRDVRPNWAGGLDNASALALAPLSADDTRRLIAELLAIDALADDVRAEVVARADGNPLYVEEFLRMLIDTGHIERRDRRWVATVGAADLAVPPTLQGLITARLDRVSPAVKTLLQRGSLAGRFFSTAALAALGDGAPPSAELLREAVRRDLIVEADDRAVGEGRVFRFRHALIREVAYGTLPKAERSLLHDRYARWLEDTLGPRSEEIGEIVAYHAEQAYLLAAELGLPERSALGARALPLLLRAARAAGDLFDARAALSFYERSGRVIEVPVTPLERAEIAGWTAYLRWANDRTAEHEAAARAVLTEVRAAGPSPVLVRLLGWITRLSDDPAESRAAYEEAMAVAAALGEPEMIAEAMSTRRAVMLYRSGADLAAVRAWLVEELEFVRRHDLRRALPGVLAELGFVNANLGDFTTGYRYRDEAVRLARASGSKLLLALALGQLATAHVHTGDLDQAARLTDESEKLARESGDRSLVIAAVQQRGRIAQQTGDLAAARAHFSDALERAQRTPEATRLWRLVLSRELIAILLESNDLVEAERVATIARDIEVDRPLVPCIRAQIRAMVAAARGDRDAADADFRTAIELSTSFRWGAEIARVRFIYARALLSWRRWDDARAQAEELIRYYADPAAKRKYHEARALMAQIDAATARA